MKKPLIWLDRRLKVLKLKKLGILGNLEYVHDFLSNKTVHVKIG